jgi:hypothetical protein
MKPSFESLEMRCTPAAHGGLKGVLDPPQAVAQNAHVVQHTAEVQPKVGITGDLLTVAEQNEGIATNYIAKFNRELSEPGITPTEAKAYSVYLHQFEAQLQQDEFIENLAGLST